jgi:hypothetical protein
VDKTLYKSSDIISILPDTVVDRTIALEHKKDSTAKPDITFLTLDADTNALPFATICLFTSRLLFDRDSCAGQNYTYTTDARGIREVRGLPEGRYYVLSSYALNSSLTWFATDSVTLPDEKQRTIPLILN